MYQNAVFRPEPAFIFFDVRMRLWFTLLEDYSAKSSFFNWENKVFLFR